MNTEERIARLEKTVRHWRWATMGLVMALLLIVSAGAVGDKPNPNPAVQPIRAKSITLVNESGKEVGSFSANKDGASLWLKSSDGDARISLKVTDDHPSLVVSGSQPSLAVTSAENQVHLGKDQISIARMMPEQQRNQAVLPKENEDKRQDAEKPGGALHISNVVSIGTVPNGSGYIDVYNRYEKNVVSIATEPGSHSGIIYLSRLDGRFGRVVAVHP